ncbi:MAG: hypothetical protein ABI462_04550 [Ignavibacteria bacterium]
MDLFHSRLKELEDIIARLNKRIEFLNKRSNKFSYYRLIIFITGAALSISGFFISKESGWILTALSLLSFSITVHFHNTLLSGMRRCYSYLKIKENNLARINIDWDKIPEPAVNSQAEDMTTGKDLDLFGKHSLHNLIDVGISFEGSSLLRKWLSNFSPADEKLILDKQNIVKELSGLQIFMDKFLLKAHLVSKKFLQSEKILEWVYKSSVINLPAWLLPVSSALILTYITLFILNIFDISGSLWLVFFLAYFFVYSSHQKRIGKVIEESLELESHLKKFTALINFIEKRSFKDQPYLGNFLRTFREGNESAAKKLNSLQKIISALIIRENPIIRLIVNIFFPYDIFYCLRLIKVKDAIKHHIKEWTDKLNELECYISLANFSYLNPDHTFPLIENTAENIFETMSIGHPLIRRANKVCNDFSFDKKNEIVIITGSNMSGKSTFLRTLGINLCLAYAGAPVNAKAMKISLYELFTCIKVNDSVVDGISYFYAEVKKLKELLDEFNNGNGLKKFFLIDEIFKGTNNKERLAGSRAFIKKLSDLKGTGFITTHDLELVGLEKEIPDAENYHFKEEIDAGQMIFDYKIHKGPCPTTNALKIMKLAGLPIE